MFAEALKGGVSNLSFGDLSGQLGEAAPTAGGQQGSAVLPAGAAPLHVEPSCGYGYAPPIGPYRLPAPHLYPRRPHHVPVPLPGAALLHPAGAQPVGARGEDGRRRQARRAQRGLPRAAVPPSRAPPRGRGPSTPPRLARLPQVLAARLLSHTTHHPPPTHRPHVTPAQGIALASDTQYKVLGAAYPWVARRLLTDTTPELRSTLMALLYKDGAFNFRRMESLISQAVRPTGRPQPRRGQSEWRPGRRCAAWGGGNEWQQAGGARLLVLGAGGRLEVGARAKCGLGLLLSEACLPPGAAACRRGAAWRRAGAAAVPRGRVCAGNRWVPRFLPADGRPPQEADLRSTAQPAAVCSPPRMPIHDESAARASVRHHSPWLPGCVLVCWCSD